MSQGCFKGVLGVISRGVSRVSQEFLKGAPRVLKEYFKGV